MYNNSGSFTKVTFVFIKALSQAPFNLFSCEMGKVYLSSFLFLLLFLKWESLKRMGKWKKKSRQTFTAC